MEKDFSNEETDWECPICYHILGEVDVIPLFKCKHIACYQCLVRNSDYMRKNGSCPLNITCSMCRASIKDIYRTNRILNRKLCLSINLKQYILYY